ncbi:DNA replication licensing factor Mcm6 [Encephalitozoon intestinalis ATCC 50506]|uniref:DNA replication licensing factor MCM6 n=1 Tax=Encephalitozoon intestinalis (strain ATCC 50506) TaxID=876142 RepID=E0S7A0_ENCIT|nr:DNA replication licensing factor Mcm6 [Encephalitozoon intestinalis ATCC 50506]ADM11528.2 DNA replication licensing factor Mcm6 [Encephalitozoon intestinalis ATCC 50506]UTX45241.1 minichromosome maintenance protein [Encephalitozoon intestinalis]
MTEEVHSKFLEFLDNTSKIRTEAEQAIYRNETVLLVDLQDVHSYSVDLYTDLVRNFSRDVDRINRSIAVYTMREFSTALEQVSFHNSQVVYKIRELKSDKLGQLLSFSGTVTRTTQVRPELSQGTFVCKVCNSVVSDVFQEFKYTEPLVCPNHLCTNRRLWKLEIDKSKFLNWQKIHVQENTEEIPPGSLPRSMDVIVRNDLVEKIRAGDKVVMTGYLIVVPDVIQLMMPQSKTVPVQSGELDEIKKKRNINIKDLNYKLSFMCIHADCSLVEDGEFTNEELAVINEMRSASDLYYKLSQSMFPSIHGHYSIKNAILLLLVGGVGKKAEGGTSLRGDINVLLVGDPGTAKSQFLKQASSFLPRSVYTSGKSSSAAGLTASVIKDGETGEFTIEAGALMLSDTGICCIDEFDKMNVRDQVSIHEAMEQQTITISKAGINATLNARTSILAAANPIKGRYDKKKTLRQNINLSAPVMSRFDLYFVLIDDANMENDRNVATHILNSHASITDKGMLASYFTKEQVKLYLRYARRKTPKMTDEAKEMLIKKYIGIRQDSLVHSNNYMMTVRHLESLIRLSEALAKIHDNEFVTKEYVEEAYRLVKSSVVEVKGEDIEIVPKTADEPGFMINSKDYIRITNSFIYLIKTRDPMERHELVEAFLSESESCIESEKALIEEQKKAENVLSFLIGKEGVLFISDGKIHIHPSYDV